MDVVKSLKWNQVNTVIIGASAAGLACAAQLKKRGLTFQLLEKEKEVGQAWRNHYDRLHLHTNKSASHLPFVKFPKQAGKYPSKAEVITYLENYPEAIGLNPKFDTEVLRASRVGTYWVTDTNRDSYQSKNLIVCTGNTNTPRPYIKPGLDTFSGAINHSSKYKNGTAFNGKRVLVIGFGNSACEIAIDLHEHGAYVAMSVRSAVNILPKEILGIPVLKIGIMQSKLSPKFADKLNKPIIDFLIGDVRKLGLKKAEYGAIEQIVRQHKIPLLDIGTVKLIKSGQVQVFGDVTDINQSEITFEDGRSAGFDAIITATGYSTGLNKIIDLDANRFNDIQLAVKKQQYFGKDNLYFCGYYVAPTGMLREINIESGIIAKTIYHQVS